MSSLWPAWATPRNPIFRREVASWRRLRFLRYLQPAAWSIGVFLGLVFLGVPFTCLALLVWVPPSSAYPVSAWQPSDFFAAGLMFLLVSGAVSGLANGLLGIIASVLAATLIAREREAQTWSPVRLTTLTTTQIVGGKLAAFLHLLRNSMHLVALWRALTLAAALGGGVLFVLAAPELADVTAALKELGVLDSLLAVGGLGLLGLIGVAAWLLEPYFTVVYNGGVGLAVSTFARSRRWAIALVFITQFALGLAVYAPVQQLTALLPVAFLSFLFALNPAAPVSPGGWMVPVMGLQFVVALALQLGVLAASVGVALYRVERLSD